MRIIDGKRTIDLADDDPAVRQIRALLYRQAAVDPVSALWERASGPLRDVLVAIATHENIAQTELESVLSIDGIGLRGRHAAIARIAKALDIEYPIRKTGGRREFRRFWLDSETAVEIRRCAGID